MPSTQIKNKIQKRISKTKRMENLAKEIGKSVDFVRTRISVLDLPKEFQTLISNFTKQYIGYWI